MSSSSSSSSRKSSSVRFPLAEIKKATDNFSDEKEIGRGEFGVTYSGFLSDGRTVAVKRFDMEANLSQEFRNEIEMLTKFPDAHLVALLGYCQEAHEMILVYEHMPNGSLADHLYGDSPSSHFLPWDHRLRICIEAARGLEYLHDDTAAAKRIIHSNLKAANILLDENWMAKISDFGYAKLGLANQTRSAVTAVVRDTSEYLDPYYRMTGQLTRRTDVFALGVVFLEVLSGRPPLLEELGEDQRSLRKWAHQCVKNGTVEDIVDHRMKGTISPKCLKAFADLACKCSHDQPKTRPYMAEVVEKLVFALTLQKGHSS